MFTNVLIGIDGRQGGRDAIALARELAAPDSAFTLAYVCAPFPGRGAGEMLRIERAASHEMLERERELAGIDAQLAVRGPRPVGRGLHEVAEQERADLLVVGSTRHALLGRALMGDDCRAALNGAPCALGVAPLGYALAPHQPAAPGRRLRRLSGERSCPYRGTRARVRARRRDKGVLGCVAAGGARGQADPGRLAERDRSSWSSVTPSAWRRLRASRGS